MLRFDGLDQGAVPRLAESLPPYVFPSPVGFFESFSLWHLNSNAWMSRGWMAYEACLHRTNDYLHHLCGYEEGEERMAPTAPLGHAVSRRWPGEGFPRLLEVHPYSMQSAGLEHRLNDPAYEEEEWYARLVRVATLGIFLFDVGRHMVRQDGVGPERLYVLHSRAHFPIESGTAFPLDDGTDLDPRLALFEALGAIDTRQGLTWG